MKVLTHGSLFAGIGGFDLGFERAGIDTFWQVEIDPFCRKVLEKNFVSAQRFNDIRECCGLSFEEHDDEVEIAGKCQYRHHLPKVDIISGGFPCQPFSTAGKRQAHRDTRFLWPEMSRVIRDSKPQFAVIENVAGLAHEFDSVLEDLLFDLEDEGYETLPPLMVPACAFGAWHRRDRVWILAYLDQGSGSAEQKKQQKAWAEKLCRDAQVCANADADGRPRTQVHEGRREEGQGADGDTGLAWWDAEPAVGRVVDGISKGLDKMRVERLGESVVPQMAEWIGRGILEHAE